MNHDEIKTRKISMFHIMNILTNNINFKIFCEKINQR